MRVGFVEQDGKGRSYDWETTENVPAVGDEVVLPIGPWNDPAVVVVTSRLWHSQNKVILLYKLVPPAPKA